MKNVIVSRRDVLRSGMALAFVSFIPNDGLTFSIPATDLKFVGSKSGDINPISQKKTGALPAEDIASLLSFSSWTIEAWGFDSMSEYPDRNLRGVISLKTEQKPSYLVEYLNAARLIRDVRTRYTSNGEAFVYLMFAGRENASDLDTHIGRARHFVFDEFVRHVNNQDTHV